MSEPGNHRSIAERHSQYVWPLVIFGVAVIAALVVIIVTGHNTDDLVRSIAALGGTASTFLSAGAFLRSTQAAKQTNGDLDSRMKESVRQGITTALKQGNAAKAVETRRARKVADPPTEKLTPPTR